MGEVGVVSGQYDPAKVEEFIKKFWEENKVYELVKEANKKLNKPFIFLDGPPYPSSDIPHVGTAWNKAIKDSVLRYKRMRGYRVLDRPGYDCHGLPIEVAVEKMIGIGIKRDIEERVGVDTFIRRCKDLVNKNIESLTRWFKELGVFMDWSNPYLTMRDEYIEAGWWLIKKAYEKGLLEREKRVVYWCPRCSTTLAEYEIEYKLIEDPSIYVKFPVKDRDKTYLLIWTTTPWTLPSNTFIMIHPDATYAEVEVGEERLIIAKDRVESVMKDAGIRDYRIVREVKGAELEGLAYLHPLEKHVPIQQKLSRYHKVVCAPDYVTLHEGTGLVHAAPGHGFEDFEVAKRLGLEFIASPVDDEGRFTSDAGKYAGLHVREANEEIIKDLEREGALLHKGFIEHRYPVCWRCKTPVILRATTQWIIKVTKLKNRLVEEAKRVQWLPKWALDRLMSMLNNLQDWVLSRQRYWGTPLPIWICPEGHITVIGSVNELVKYAGEKPQELHRPWIDRITIKCPKCGREARRVPDVADVWFDSGIAFYASRGHPEQLRNSVLVEFITEGHDQIRGWFFSLLRAGVIGFDKAPYRVVLVHGFALDEHGREMHKSLGNYVGLNEVIEKAGRDVFRYWVLQNTTWEDMRFSWRGLEETRRDLSIAWNVFVFASTYMSLDHYDPTIDTLEKHADNLRIEDRWILSRLYTMIKRVTRAMDEYRVHDAVRATRDFIVEDVSHWYIRLIRPRVWVEENTPDKLAAYATLYTVLKNWLIVVAPFAPFITEYLYQLFIRRAEENAPPTIHLASWPEVKEEYIDQGLEEEMGVIREIFEAVASARMKAGLKLRHPVRKVIVFTGNRRIAEIVDKHRELIARVANARTVETQAPTMLEKIVTYKVEPIYSSLGPTFKKHTKEVIAYLKEHEKDVARDIISRGYHEAVVAGKCIRITGEHVKVIPSYITGYSVQELSWGSIAIDTRLTEDELAEGIARDIIRRIQVMRKSLELPLDARIAVYMYAPQEHRSFVEAKKDLIAQEVRASEIVIVDSKDHIEGAKGLYKRSWEIMGEGYLIGIKQVS